MNRIALLLVALLLPSPSFAAPEPGDLSPELAILQRRVGTWDNINTIKPGPWNPQGSRTESAETIRWIFGRGFIEGNARETGTGLLNTHLMSYDPASKSYRMWYFDSTGNAPHAPYVGQWDAASQTLGFSSDLPDGVKFKAMLKFVDENHMDWDAVWTGKDGAVLMDLQGKQTRRAPGAGQGDVAVAPKKEATPDPKGPPELKRLVGYVGDWNAEVRDNLAPQPTWDHAESNHKTWALGGRFIRDEVRNEEGDMTMLGLWTYDTTERAHREWYFLADGNVIEFVAGWDEATSTLKLDGKLMRGGTIRGTRQVTGPKAYIWDAIIRDDAGKIVANLSGRQERPAHNLP